MLILKFGRYNGTWWGVAGVFSITSISGNRLDNQSQLLGGLAAAHAEFPQSHFLGKSRSAISELTKITAEFCSLPTFPSIFAK